MILKKDILVKNPNKQEWGVGKVIDSVGRDNWSEEINLALKESKVFIAIGTQKEYMNSQWV